LLPILLGILGPLLGKVVDTVGSKLGVDLSTDEMKSKRLDIELEVQKLLAEQEKAIQEANMAQIEVNKTEAVHENIFVSGWRPFIGWICGTALAYHFILQPLLAFLINNVGGEANLPTFDMQSLLTVLMGMLGLGAMRSYEKVYGVARDPGTPSTYQSKAVPVGSLPTQYQNDPNYIYVKNPDGSFTAKLR
jgi:hypothetical protein